jgi:hypothetical protein
MPHHGFRLMKIKSVRFEERRLQEVSADSYVLNGVRLKAAPHPIEHIWKQLTDFP